MAPNEEREAVRLYALCHPTWPAPPPRWHFAHPTLVIRAHGRVVASTSFTVAATPIPGRPISDDEVMWGYDVCVAPHYRGQGLGLALCQARLDIGRELGLRFFIGMTWPGNAPMIRVFDQLGCVLHAQRVPNRFPQNPPEERTGLMYTRGI